jgi:hypothetical protein
MLNPRGRRFPAAALFCYERLMPEIVTANRLADGVVVFQTADGRWTEDFKRARILSDVQDSQDALARARQDEGQNIIVDAYAVPVVERNGHFAPQALREAIRAAGPTTRRDLGKQAQGQAPYAAANAPTEADHVSL